MSKEFFVNALQTDEEFTDFFMVKAASVRTGSNKKLYFDATLGDRTGEINAKKWDVSDDEAIVLGTLREGDMVKIRAGVTEWNGARQLRIQRIRVAGVNDPVEMTDYIKAAPEDPKEMHAYILDRAKSISDPALRKIAVKFLEDNEERLLYYPAAMRNHHAEQAGLLWHIKRMLMLGELACGVYTILDRDWVVCGVILHDMEKLNEIQSNELGISPGYSFEGKLLGHIAQGVKAVETMAGECGLTDEQKTMLEHMILSHHYEPEYGSPCAPDVPGGGAPALSGHPRREHVRLRGRAQRRRSGELFRARAHARQQDAVQAFVKRG